MLAFHLRMSMNPQDKSVTVRFLIPCMAILAVVHVNPVFIHCPPYLLSRTKPKGHHLPPEVFDTGNSKCLNGSLFLATYNLKSA